MTNAEKSKVSMEEPTAPEIFHIHIDSQDPVTDDTTAFNNWVVKTLGFYHHDFIGHPAGYKHFEPSIHSTFKTRDKNEFEKVWSKLVNKVKDFPNMFGYLEGEYIPTDKRIAFKPITEFFLPKFSVLRRTLTEIEEFRQTEFHLVLDNKYSDQRVITALLDAGLYGAILDKKDYQAIVLTAQGHRRIIHPLMKEVKDYLNRVGGVVRCTLKEEISIHGHKVNIIEEKLPEIVDQLILLS